jgi:CubicO group peptidase (beta-lactamase class C family)
MKSTLFLLLFLFSAQLVAIGQELNPAQREKLDSLFGLIESNRKGMGGISIFKNGQEIYSHYYGFRSLKDSLRPNSETKYRIGSMTKMFTSVVILNQVAENRISLDTKLGEFFPNVVNADQITVEQLLAHRSGIPNFTDLPDYGAWKNNAQTRAEMLERIQALPSNFAPDERFEYSNTNFLLLSYVAEAVSGMDFHTLLQKYILQPAGMQDTYIGEKIDPKNNEALSYIKLVSWELDQETHSSVTLGAGAISSTSQDINLFLKALFGGQLVDAAYLPLISTFRDGHSLGFQEFVFEGHKGIGHGGTVDGFQAYGTYFAEETTSLVFTGNAVLYPMYDIVTGALRILFDLDYTLPLFPRLEEKDLKKFTGSYANENFPFQFNINVQNGELVAEGGGHMFALEYVEGDTFKFDLIGLVLDFVPGENKMLFKQSGGEFVFERKKE